MQQSSAQGEDSVACTIAEKCIIYAAFAERSSDVHTPSNMHLRILNLWSPWSQSEDESQRRMPRVSVLSTVGSG